MTSPKVPCGDEGGPSSVQPLRHLLGFDWNQDVVFVLPTLLAGSPPRQAVGIEDVHAIEAMSKALVENAEPGVVVDVEFADDLYFLDPGALRRNLITVCGPRRNSFTAAILRHPMTRSFFKCHFGVAEQPGSREHGRFLAVDDDTFWSLDSNPDEDFALIAKVPNPWSEESNVVIVAGTRGIGTWGAGELFRNSTNVLYHWTRGADFVAVVKVAAHKYFVSPDLTSCARLAESGRVRDIAPTGPDDWNETRQVKRLLVSRPDPELWGPEPSASSLPDDTLGGAVAAEQAAEILEGALKIEDVTEALSIGRDAVHQLLDEKKLFAVKQIHDVVFPYWQFDVSPEAATIIPRLRELIEAFPGNELGLCSWMVRAHPDLSFLSPADAIAEGRVDDVLQVVASLGSAGW